MRASALALVFALPATAIGGGYEGPGAYGRTMPDCAARAAGASCVQDGGVVALRGAATRGVFHELLRDRPRVEYFRGRPCPYPTRASDSPLSGGAGYIIKDDVRAVIGCAS